MNLIGYFLLFFKPSWAKTEILIYEIFKFLESILKPNNNFINIFTNFREYNTNNITTVIIKNLRYLDLIVYRIFFVNE